jgi:hypothetical protein
MHNCPVKERMVLVLCDVLEDVLHIKYWYWINLRFADNLLLSVQKLALSGAFDYLCHLYSYYTTIIRNTAPEMKETIKIVNNLRRGPVLTDPAKRLDILPQLSAAFEIDEAILEFVLESFTREVAFASIPTQKEILLRRALATRLIRSIMPTVCPPNNIVRLQVSVPVFNPELNTAMYLATNTDFCVEKTILLSGQPLPPSRFAEVILVTVLEHYVASYLKSRELNLGTMPEQFDANAKAQPHFDLPLFRDLKQFIRDHPLDLVTVPINADIDQPARLQLKERYDTALAEYIQSTLTACDHRRAVSTFRRFHKPEILADFIVPGTGLFECRKCHQSLICEHELICAGLTNEDAIEATKQFQGDSRHWMVMCTVCGRQIGIDYGRFYTSTDPDMIGRSDLSKLIFGGTQGALGYLAFDSHLLSSGDFAAQASSLMYDLLDGFEEEFIEEEKDDMTRFFAFCVCLLYAVNLILSGNKSVRLVGCELRGNAEDKRTALESCFLRTTFARWRNLVNRFPSMLTIARRLVPAVANRKWPFMENKEEEKNYELLCRIASDNLVQFHALYAKLIGVKIKSLFEVVDPARAQEGVILVRQLKPQDGKLGRLYAEIFRTLGGNHADKHNVASANVAQLMRLSTHSRPYSAIDIFGNYHRRPFDLSVVYFEDASHKVKMVEWDHILYSDGSHFSYRDSIKRAPGAVFVDFYSSALDIRRRDFLAAKKKQVHPPIPKRKLVSLELADPPNFKGLGYQKITIDRVKIRSLVSFGNINTINALGMTEKQNYQDIAKGRLFTPEEFTSISDPRILKISGYLFQLQTIVSRVRNYEPLTDKVGIARVIMTRAEQELPVKVLGQPIPRYIIRDIPRLAPKDTYDWYLQEIAFLVDAVSKTELGKFVVSAAVSTILRDDETYTKYAAEKVRIVTQYDDTEGEDVSADADVGRYDDRGVLAVLIS